MAPRTASEERHATQSELEKRRSGPSMLSFHDGKLLKRSAVMATDRLDMASTLPARSAILPRSASMSGGAIAGAVVGSVIGVTLIFLCLLPFVLRAIRQRAARRRHGELGGPEMAIGPDLGGLPGYGLAPPLQPDSSRRLSREHFAPVISPAQAFVPRPVKEFVVDGSAGFAFRDEYSQSPTGTATTQVTQSPVAPAQPDLSAVGGAVTTSPVQDGGLPLAPAAGWAQGPVEPTQPGPEAGDVEMAAASELPHAARHHRFHVGVPSAMKHIAAALRRSSTRSSGDAQIEPPTRSPTLDQGHYLSSTVSAPPIFESYGDDPRGASYSYYHDPDILNESPASASPVQQTPASYPPPPGAPAMYNMNLMSAPAAMLSTAGAELSAPSSPEYGSPEYTHFPRGRASPMHISSPDVKQEPSPEDESTVSPGTPTARETDIANAALARGRVQELKMEAADGESTAQTAAPFRKVMRMDTLPISGITADSPTTGQGADLPVPAGINPMDIMAPSNDTEMTHRVKHELDVIANSPPPQVFTATLVEPSDPVSDSSPEQFSDDGEDGRDIDMLDISDYSTPPTFSHSSGPSIQNTPDTRVSDTFTASPSPRPPHDDGELANGDNPGNSSPHPFQCEKCGRQFDQIHKLNHHRRYHERPHECPHRDCGMRFGTKTHLARHINDKHDKKRKYYCMVTDCPYSRQGGKSFPRKDNWRRHMQNKHQITPETDPGAEYVDEVMGGV